MRRRPVPGLVASLVLHAVLVAAVLTALPRSELLPALFIDLTAAALSEGPAAPAVAPSAATRVRMRPRPASSDSPAPVPVSPPAPSPVPVAPPPVTSTGDATASAPPLPAPEPSAAAPAEPEEPSASAASGEPSPGPPPGASVLNDGAGGETAPSAGGVAVAPELRGAPPIQSDGSGGRAGAGQELARRSPGGEGGEAPQALYNEYLARLRQRVHDALHYPAAARRRGLTGAVTVELTIVPSGAIRDVSIVESSSHPVLDQAAVDTLRELRAQPFPANVPPRTLRVRLPVVFQLQ